MTQIIRSILCSLLLCGFVVAPMASPEGINQGVWRRNTAHLTADRALVRACLDRNGDCLRVVQQACLGNPDRRTAAEERTCDWRAMAAWEDEVAATLADLRAQLTGRNLENLNASQRAWEVSMLADVSVGMDLLEGGSSAGPEGAHIRAQAEAQRGIYLDEIRRLIE